MLAIDRRNSTQWAIASVESAGMILVGQTTFDLVNRETGRAHRLKLAAAGISGKLPIAGSFSMSNYTNFTTRHRANFDDFDGKGARQTSENLIIYSRSYLTIFDGAAYLSSVLCYTQMAGWGPSIPSIGVEHGVTELVYGDGNPLGIVESVVSINLPPSREDLDYRIRLTQQDDSNVLIIQGDALFDFDKDKIKAEAVRALTQAGAIISSYRISRLLRKVVIHGHTDSKGDKNYNKGLSERRAKAVSQWLISNRYLKDASAVETIGHGDSDPAAPDKRPDGSDDPVGRAKNRRVEIALLK